MKKLNKIISLLLAAVMMIGSFTALITVNAFAATDSDDTEIDLSDLISTKKPEDYTEAIYRNADEKIATMKLAFRNKGYSIYVDDWSGEVAVVNEKTGEKLFTNPWDVASDKSSNSTTDDSTTGSIKEQLLSQIELSFTDITGQSYTYTSFRMASMKNQVIVKNIKGGIRVEYTIGREQAKMLVPHYIEASRFEDLIKSKVIEGMKPTDPTGHDTERFLVEFTPVSKYEINPVSGQFILDDNGNKIEKSDSEKKKLYEDFPALKDIDLMYTLEEDVSSPVLARLEQVIKTYCPEYSYEELEYDHEMTKYQSDDENPPVFKMALEYTIDDQGLCVRLPANGMRFNESLYTLNSLTVLPYMGAGSNWCEGYNFMPDGSGALYEFDKPDTKTAPVSVYSQVYGSDYAYHELDGTYEKTIRYPVFGTVVTTKEYTYTTTNSSGNEEVTKVNGTVIDKINSEIDIERDKKLYGELYDIMSQLLGDMQKQEVVTEQKSGFLAIIEEGDALTKISSYHGGNQNDYNSVKMQFTPRPSDSYNLQESLSVSGVGEWTVVSKRKYLGNYKMRYIMLSDGDKAAENGTEVYDASWLGMAVAYRDYLTKNGILSPLSKDKLTDDIPLYIESFGALQTIEKVLSVPVKRMTAMTTFDNVGTMYDELAYGNGIKNVNFKLTGFTKGGMYYTVPKNIKFEKAVGGKKGFQKLLDHAAEVSKDDGYNLGIFPDFDFAYVMGESAFDGFSQSKHVAKTIDDRYASKRVYSATQQRYINYYDLVISPAYFSEFYEKLVDKYLKFSNLNGISVSTLGNALNSDFDEDEPYNREDSKQFTIDAFKYLDSNLEGLDIMTSGGNAYTWKYVDHILDVALDSSRQSRASSAVPFIGVVLHGSVQFAGEPLNMEGDIQYAMLKAIENGASPYFVLSYQNTDILKEDMVLSKYYSIRYDIWKDDLISAYNTLNEVLGDVQDKYIIDYVSVNDAIRVPDTDEIEADILNAINKYVEFEKNYLENLRIEAERALATARENVREAEVKALENMIVAIDEYDSLNEIYIAFFDREGNNGSIRAGYITALKNAIESGNERNIRTAVTKLSNEFKKLSGTSYRKLRDIVNAAEEYLKLATESVATIKDKTDDAYIISDAEGRLQIINSYFNNKRLMNSQPAATKFKKALTLADRDSWIDGAPTYIYGLVGTRYIYVVGCDEQGYDFYYYNASGALMRVVEKNTVNSLLADNKNHISGNLTNGVKAVPGTGVVRRGTAADVSDTDVYYNGTIMNDLEIFYDGGYYSEVTDARGNIHYIYYENQSSYKAILEGINSMIETVITSVADVDRDLADELEKTYKASLDIKDNVDDDVVEEDKGETSKYTVDNVVIITYGSNGVAYKNIILNYNNFTVTVEFNGIEYTIPGYDFVAIKAQEGR